MNIRITDKGGLKPTFTQWDVDRVLLISGCDSQPSLRFDNPELSRSIVVVAEADGSDWKCNVPNFMLQFSGPMIVSVFIQPDEGKTVFTARYAVQWAKKPQDYTYEENIGYTNWVQKTEEAQELLDDIEDLRDEIQTAVDTATSASEAAVAAAEDIDETVAAALQAAKDSGDFDGADGVSPAVTVTSITGGHNVNITDKDHPTGQGFDVMDGTDGVSPGVTIASITGGHTVTITDEDNPGGQSFNVMDGQDAVVDATLSNAGEAADAAVTGAGISAAQHTADYALRFAETLNNGAGIPLDAEWLSGDIGGSRPYRVHSKRAVNTEQKVLQAATGYRFYLRIYSNGSYSDSSWYGPGYSSRKTYTLPKGADYIVVVSTNPEDTSVTADPEVYGAQVTIKNNIGSGGGSITVDDALSGSSENPVQNKVIKAALDAKGTYSKPSGGIPASDLASGIAVPSGGTVGQVLKKTADGPAWENESGGGGAADVFWATYGTTGSADIETAYQAGKIVLTVIDVDGEDVVLQLVKRASSTYHGFTGFSGSDIYNTSCDTNVWGQVTTGVIPYAYTSNPEALGVASAGLSGFFSRGDHVHPKPSASDIGAVAVAQGVTHAGEFVVVGSDGNITTVSIPSAQGVSF